MSHYYDKEDVAYRSQMAKAAPKEFQAFVGLMRVVGIEDGAIPRKYRELIAIAVAHATGCVYCIEAHVKEARKIDVSKEELSEAIMISSAPCPARAGAKGGSEIGREASRGR